MNQKDNLNIFSENLINSEITEEMKKSYIDYAMSVIVTRALPDVRDGFKPVHRRIIYSMHEQSLYHNSKYKKSAKVVGDVLGKYHPHSDTAVYDSLVRLAQDFAMRYPLIDGQGNYGSVDGDRAASMRYTECRMQKIAEEMIKDIEKETVELVDNYDGSEKEPKVLPSAIPNLILNGIVGIAVGMATNIPPHNLKEVMEALIYLIDNTECNIEDLLQFIKGPDFPTGGVIFDQEAIKEAYSTGRGRIIIRAVADIEESKNGKMAIIVKEIPYQINKSNLITKIADLVKSKKIIGITDIRDESNKEGMKINIELKRDSQPKKILNQLFKYTEMQTSFNYNMIALTEDGLQPNLLDVKEILQEFINHREIIITKKTQYELKKAEERAHILEGLKIALDHIDEIIALIKKSENKNKAKENLIKQFELTEIQAEAILNMKLQNLAGLERKKVENELKEKLELIIKLKDILAHREKILLIVKEEFEDIKNKYADERKTQINPNKVGEFKILDTIPDEDMIVTITRENYIKRLYPNSYKVQHRGGKGIIGMTTKEQDEISQMIFTSTHKKLLFFTNKGRVFSLPVYEIPLQSRTSKGQPIVNLLNLQDGEIIVSTLNTDKLNLDYLFLATRQGVVKKINLKDIENIRSNGLIVAKMRENDEIIRAKMINKKDEIILLTHLGYSIKFNSDEIRTISRNAVGVRGIKLREKDFVVKMDTIKDPLSFVICVTEKGLAKKTKIEQYRLQKRGGLGIKAFMTTPRTGNIAGVKIITKDTKGDLLIVSKKGQIIRIPLKSIPTRGRVTQGVYIMRLKSDEYVANISLIKS